MVAPGYVKDNFTVCGSEIDLISGLEMGRISSRQDGDQELSQTLVINITDRPPENGLLSDIAGEGAIPHSVQES
jgi:hypothetical protein